MDLSSLLGTVLSEDSLAGVSKKTGVSASSVKSVLSTAIPTLVNGMKQQSSGNETADGFATALTDHAKADTANLSSFLKGVDLEDGAKIVSHLLGDSKAKTTKQIAKAAGTTKAQTSSILSTVAPLLMSLLGKQTTNNASSSSAVNGLVGSLLGNSDIGSIVSGLTGLSSELPSSSGGLLGLFKKIGK